MISCVLRGQMGNQMFQVATTIAHAIRNNTAFIFPERSGKRDQFPFMFPHLPTTPMRVQDVGLRDFYREQEFGVYNPIPNSNDQLLQGYFQSELYFKDQRSLVEQAFCIPQYETERDTVSIHVRRGDYVGFDYKFPQLTREYVYDACSYFGPDWRFLVFSDDIEYCKRQLGDKFSYFEDQNPVRSMAKMASCEHHIIANSSFSWWAAWLDPKPTKKVICPRADQWFVKEYAEQKGLSAQDIPCKDWIQMSL
jgi:glycosyl transferase family 11